MDINVNMFAKEATCDLCGKSFSNIYTLKAHKTHIHEGIKRFQCDLCNARCETKYKLKRHRLGVHSEERNFNCNICDQSFKTRDMLVKHQRKHFQGMGPFICSSSECTETFKFKSGLDYHIKLKHAKNPLNIKSLNLPKKTKTVDLNDEIIVKEKAPQHLEKQEENINANQGEIFTCEYCLKQYKTKLNFEIHLTSHESANDFEDYEYVTDEDIEMSSMNKNVSDDTKVATLKESHNCLSESLESNDIIYLQFQDVETVQENEDEIINETIVIEDSKTNDVREVIMQEIDFSVSELLKEEDLYDGKEEEDETIDVEINQAEGSNFEDDKRIFCETIIVEDLKQNNNIDIDYSYSKLLNDDETFYENDFLKSNGRHVKSSKESRVICDICGSTFKNKSHFNRHTLRKHRKDCHKIECNICGAKFLLNYELRRHMLKHSTIRDFFCKQCDKRFKSETYLINHVKTLHLPRKRIFKCNSCDRSYFTKHNLDYHMRKHEAVYRYKCETCNPEKSFYYADGLKWHIIRHHGETAPFNCEICNKPFIYEKSLLTHMTMHKKGYCKMPVECPICGKSISEKRNLKKHMKRHTEKFVS